MRLDLSYHLLLSAVSLPISSSNDVEAAITLPWINPTIILKRLLQTFTTAMDTILYASYGALCEIIAREARLAPIPEPQFTPFDLSFVNGYSYSKNRPRPRPIRLTRSPLAVQRSRFDWLAKA